MSLLLALLLVVLTAWLAVRLPPGGLLLFLGGLLGVGWALGARAEALLAVLSLTLGTLAAPRWPGMRGSRIRPRKGVWAKGPPKAPRLDASSQGFQEVPKDLGVRYEVIDRLGAGGMATVYRAKDRRTGRVVALKIPQERLLGDPRFVRRFQREAEVLSSLEHPNIVKVYDYGQVQGRPYIVMEYLDGEGLDRLIEERRLNLKQAAAILARVADALRHIHRHGIVHRDIKPGNIMVLRGALREDGVDPKGVRLMDFGIAAGALLTRLTMTGARIGTPVYMSPEQAKGQKLDHRSDIYSLGVVLYEALTGQPPFSGGYEAVIHQQIFQVPTPPDQLRPEIPKALSELVLRMLEKDPSKRPSLEEVIEILEGPWEEDLAPVQGPCLLLGVEAKRGALRLLRLDGTPLRFIGGIGSAHGHFSSPPLAVAADGEGGIWVAVFEKGGNLLRRFSPQGELLLSTGPYGTRPGEFLLPIGLAATEEEVFVLDGETCTITRLGLDGSYRGRFGGKGPGRGTFREPRALAIAGDSLLVLDYGNRQVQRLTLDGRYLSRYALRQGDGPVFRLLGGMGVEGERLYLLDLGEGEGLAKVRALSLEGRLLASWPLPLGEGEDPRALADLLPWAGVLYVARRGSSLIQRLDLATGKPLPPLEVYAPIQALGLWRGA